MNKYLKRTRREGRESLKNKTTTKCPMIKVGKVKS